MLKFTAYGQPLPKQRPHFGGRSRSKTAKGRRKRRVFTPQRTIDWQNVVGTFAVNAMSLGDHEMFVERVACVLLFYRQKKRKADIDNLEKAVLDGCEGIVYVNDKIVHPVFTDVFYDADEPRVEVWFFAPAEIDAYQTKVIEAIALRRENNDDE